MMLLGGNLREFPKIRGPANHPSLEISLIFKAMFWGFAVVRNNHMENDHQPDSRRKYAGVLSQSRTKKLNHPFYFRLFHEINHPAIGIAP